MLLQGSIQPETLEVDSTGKKWYFKGFLINNKINRRKFGIIDPEVIDRYVDTFIGLPLTEVEDGIRKDDHAQPEDSGIVETKYPNKFDFVKDAINYYRNYAKAKIINVFRPDRNIFEASKANPNETLTWYAQYETTNEELAKRIEASKANPELTPKVSPSVYGVRWHYNENKEIVVDEFVGTHVGIVKRGAYGDVAYIKPEVCNVDGKTCYYKLLNASDLEGINNNDKSTNSIMSNETTPKQGLGLIEKAIFNTQIPTTLEDWTNSGYALEVVDQNSIDLNSIAKSANSEYIIFKKKSENNNNQQPQNNNMNTNNNEQNQNQQQTTPTPPTTNINGNQYVHINDVNTLIEKAKNDIKTELTNQFTTIIENQKKENTKAAILSKYFDSLANHKEYSGKLDMDKINQEKEKYNKLAVDPETLETILENSIFNPRNTSAANFISKFANPESSNNNEQDPSNKGNNNNNGQGNQTNQSKSGENTHISNSVTSIPPRGSGADNLANFTGNPSQGHNAYRVDGDNSPNGNGATGINPNTGSTAGNTGEFKSSDNFSAASYSDNYKGDTNNKNQRTGHDITGDSIPKKFKHLVSNGVG